MTPYQREQVECFEMVREHFAAIPKTDLEALRIKISDYLSFRRKTRLFLLQHFSRMCHSKCYRSRLSACCSRDGIVVFFADVAVNTLISSEGELDRINDVLQKPHEGFKCVYLGDDEEGCLWRLKPIVCEMFLCDEAKNKGFKDNPDAGKEWDVIQISRKRFTWPDRPVLFDELEQLFLNHGYHSPLMYLQNSPGLLRIKKMGKKRIYSQL